MQIVPVDPVIAGPAAEIVVSAAGVDLVVARPTIDGGVIVVIAVDQVIVAIGAGDGDGLAEAAGFVG